MANYKVAISETSVRVLELEAPSMEDALQIIKDDYFAGNIVLDSGDFMEASFLVQDENGKELEG